VRDAPESFHRHGLASGTRCSKTWASCWLDADDFHLPVAVLARYGHAGDEAAAAHCHHHCLDLRPLLHDLDAAAPGAVHNRRMVEAVDVRHLAGLGKAFRMLAGVVEARPLLDHFRLRLTTFLGRSDRRAGRHHDGHLNAKAPAVVREGERVVAQRCGNDSTRFLVVR